MCEGAKRTDGGVYLVLCGLEKKPGTASIVRKEKQRAWLFSARRNLVGAS